MTGIARKTNPYTREFHIDWIQCCRVKNLQRQFSSTFAIRMTYEFFIPRSPVQVGFGKRVSHPPPVTYSNDYGGRAAFSAPAVGGPMTAPIVPEAYQHQYRTMKSRNMDRNNRTTRGIEESEHLCDDTASFRFAGRGVPSMYRSGATPQQTISA